MDWLVPMEQKEPSRAERTPTEAKRACCSLSDSPRELVGTSGGPFFVSTVTVLQ